MSKYNIHNRKRLSEKEIAALKNFNEVEARIKKGNATNGNWFGSWGYLLPILLVGIVAYFGSKYALSDKKESPKTGDTLSQKPARKIASPFSTFGVNKNSFEEILEVAQIEKGVNWLTKSNTLVRVKPNSLRNSKGELATGKATLKISEYHDVIDVFVAGIPMEYDSAEYTYHFKTGGMFELTAQQNGAKLAIDSTKKVTVLMSSSRKENENFNTYFYDTIKNEWEYKGNSDPLKRKITYNTNNALEKENAIKSVAKTGIKLNYNKAEFPELALYDEVVFYPINATEETYTKIKTTQWEDIKLQKNKKGNYELTALNRSQKITVEVITNVALEEKSKQAAKIKAQSRKDSINTIEYMEWQYGNNNNENGFKSGIWTGGIADSSWKLTNVDLSFSPQYNYSLNFQSIANEEIISIFEIEEFGMWNCDAPEKLPQGMLANNTHFLDLETGDTIPYKSLYYLSEYDKQLMYTFFNSGEKFSYNPKNKNVIWFVHLMDDGNSYLFYADQELFKKCEIDRYKNHLFKMKKHKINIKEINPEEIKKVLKLS